MYTQLLKIFSNSNYAVFPVVIANKSDNHPDSGCLKIVSGVMFPDGKWHYTDSYNNMKSWDDVFEYYLLEIDKLERLVNASSEEDRMKIYDAEKTEIIGIDELDFLHINQDGNLNSKIEFKNINEDSPRRKEAHWEPILAAWEFSLKELLSIKKNNKLIEL